MSQEKMFKKMLDFQKATFNNSYNAMDMLRGQGEKFLDNMVESSPWIPNEGKKALQEWNSAYKKGCADFKVMVDNNFKKAEEYLQGTPAKPAAKAKSAS